MEQNNNVKDAKLVSNRFGKFEINSKKKIYFPNGLIGMPRDKKFCIVDIPDYQHKPFKLLQSYDNEDLAFVIMPVMGLYESKFDFEHDEEVINYFSEFAINQDNLLIVLIANFVNEQNKIVTFVNSTAPLLIDADLQIGYQVVLQNKKYKIRDIV